MLPTAEEIRATPFKTRVLVTEPHVAAHLSDLWQQMKKRFTEKADMKSSDCKSPTYTVSSQGHS
jgi:hypothetical protein